MSGRGDVEQSAVIPFLAAAQLQINVQAFLIPADEPAMKGLMPQPQPVHFATGSSAGSIPVIIKCIQYFIVHASGSFCADKSKLNRGRITELPHWLILLDNLSRIG
ncbi:hypothetical protein D3C73_1340350 [compost metagenome]